MTVDGDVSLVSIEYGGGLVGSHMNMPMPGAMPMPSVMPMPGAMPAPGYGMPVSGHISPSGYGYPKSPSPGHYPVSNPSHILCKSFYMQFKTL